MTHSDLIPVAYRWAIKTAKCGVAFKEFKTLCPNSEIPDVLGFKGYGQSVLVEVKVSRSDFLKDKEKQFRKYPDKGMGTFRFFMCPTGLIKPEELPANWGLVYVNANLKAKTVVNPYCASLNGNIWSNGFEKCSKSELSFMYSALRRLHIKGHIESIYDKEYVLSFKEKF